jgi:hypothetical protein
LDLFEFFLATILATAEVETTKSLATSAKDNPKSFVIPYTSSRRAADTCRSRLPPRSASIETSLFRQC